MNEQEDDLQEEIFSAAEGRSEPVIHEMAEYVSDKIGIHWKGFASLRLNLDENVIDEISSVRLQDGASSCFSSIRKWQARRGSKANVGELVKACSRHGRNDLAQWLLEFKLKTAKSKREGQAKESNHQLLEASKLAQTLKEKEVTVALFGNSSDDLYGRVERSLQSIGITIRSFTTDSNVLVETDSNVFGELESCSAVVDVWQACNKKSSPDEKLSAGRRFQGHALSLLDAGKIAFIKVQRNESGKNVPFLWGLPTLYVKKNDTKSKIEKCLIRALYALTEGSAGDNAEEEANYKMTMNVIDLPVFRSLEKLFHATHWIPLLVTVAVLHIAFSIIRIVDHLEKADESVLTGIPMFLLQVAVRIFIPALCLWALRILISMNNPQSWRIDLTSKESLKLRKHLGSYVDRRTLESMTPSNLCRKIIAILDDILFYCTISAIGQGIVSVLILTVLGGLNPSFYPEYANNLYDLFQRITNLGKLWTPVFIVTENVCLILSLCCWQVMLACFGYVQKILGYYFDLDSSDVIGKDIVQRIHDQWKLIFSYLPIIFGVAVILLYFAAFSRVEPSTKKDVAFFIVVLVFSLLQLFGAWIDTTVAKVVLALHVFAVIFLVMLQPSLPVSTAKRHFLLIFLVFVIQAGQLLLLKAYSRWQKNSTDFSQWSLETRAAILEILLTFFLFLVWIAIFSRYSSQKS